MERTADPYRRWLVGVAAVVLVVVTVWACWGWIDPSGDPGGTVMAQLTPTLTAVPGYGTPAVPVVDQIPESLDAPYVILTEPHQDSCDGRPGTEGWSQVVVQSRFRWGTGLAPLVAVMGPRLARLGWTVVPQPSWASPPTATWRKTLSDGGRGFLSIGQEGGAGSTTWQFDAVGDPVGTAASGC